MTLISDRWQLKLKRTPLLPPQQLKEVGESWANTSQKAQKLSVLTRLGPGNRVAWVSLLMLSRCALSVEGGVGSRPRKEERPL